ncbi:MAG: serine/threonine-protein kinase [Planctomycetota bacterium]|nr:serine/threonine-protein kinase [Planctomycetota bacterium]
MISRDPSPENRLRDELASRARALRDLEAAFDAIPRPAGAAAGLFDACFELDGDGGAGDSVADSVLDDVMNLLALPPPKTGRIARAESAASNAFSGDAFSGDAAFDSSWALGTLDPSVTCLLPPLTSDGAPGGASGADELWKEIEAGGPLIRGRYVVEELIFRGSLSRVYRGVDEKRGRPVAIKVVASPASDVVRAALEEVHSLDHESILRVDDHGDVGKGGLFLVSPLLGGTTLRGLLSSRRAAPGALLLAFRKASEGVAHAHARHIVHRDLKPANIQVEPDGRTVVLDWGLACREGHTDSPARGILGTPLYMAPEQIEGGPVSPQTDVYALGTLLYEIATGFHPAGPAGDVAQILFRVRKQSPPPPSALGSSLSQPADDVVLRCLAKDPASRYRNAGELLEDLEGLG